MSLPSALGRASWTSIEEGSCPILTFGGGFAGGTLLGFVALTPGWIDHLYVDPEHHRQGIGSALVMFSQTRQDTLSLYSFQANLSARRLYEWHGFVVEELTDGARNEEKMPDVTYRWRRSAGLP